MNILASTHMHGQMRALLFEHTQLKEPQSFAHCVEELKIKFVMS